MGGITQKSLSTELTTTQELITVVYLRRQIDWLHMKEYYLNNYKMNQQYFNLEWSIFILLIYHLFLSTSNFAASFDHPVNLYNQFILGKQTQIILSYNLCSPDFHPHNQFPLLVFRQLLPAISWLCYWISMPSETWRPNNKQKQAWSSENQKIM